MSFFHILEMPIVPSNFDLLLVYVNEKQQWCNFKTYQYGKLYFEDKDLHDNVGQIVV